MTKKSCSRCSKPGTAPHVTEWEKLACQAIETVGSYQVGKITPISECFPWLSEGRLTGAFVSIMYFPTLLGFFTRIITYEQKINNETLYRHYLFKILKSIFKKAVAERHRS